jgi:deleted-in-malignant-brain-tumors protein 1
MMPFNIRIMLNYLRDFGPGQQCCYGDDGTIITGNNGGTADLIAPTNWYTKILHFLVDVYPWFLCCFGPFKDCSRYTSRRPVDDCSEWPERPPPGMQVNDGTVHPKNN